MLVGGDRHGPKNRRRAGRIWGPALTAVYWTGGANTPLRVRDINADGAYIETDRDWFVGTVVHLVLQREGADNSSALESFGLWARIVRNEPGGIGVEFIMDRSEGKQFRRFLEAAPGTDGTGS